MQTPILDSVQTIFAISTAEYIATTILLSLGVILKIVMDGAKKLSTRIETSPDHVKACIVLLFGQLTTWIGVKTGVWIDPDPTVLQTTVEGLLIALTAMGVHRVSKLRPTSTT
jgi:hypothetical protein